jgi:hypothetical protein
VEAVSTIVVVRNPSRSFVHIALGIRTIEWPFGFENITASPSDVDGVEIDIAFVSQHASIQLVELDGGACGATRRVSVPSVCSVSACAKAATTAASTSQSSCAQSRRLFVLDLVLAYTTQNASDL